MKTNKLIFQVIPLLLYLFTMQCVLGQPNNLVQGDHSGQYLGGAGNTFYGHYTGSSPSNSGDLNIFIGVSSGQANTTGSENVFVGATSGLSNTTGDYNTFLGSNSGFYNSTGNRNTFLGAGSGFSNSTAIYNTFVGFQSGYSTTTGSYNNFTGYRSGYSNTSGEANTFTGEASGYSNSTGSRNTFTGHLSGRNHATGSNNTFTGEASGYSSTTGDRNTFTGTLSGRNHTTGSDNTFTGEASGFNHSNGSRNTFIGAKSGHNNQSNGNVFIGYQAGYDESGANKLYITNSNDATPLIYGDFSTDLLTVNGMLDVVQPGGTSSHSALKLRAGNSSQSYGSNQILFSWNGGPHYMHAIKTRHHGGEVNGNAIDFYLWDKANDTREDIGTMHVMSLNGGNVGIGIKNPDKGKLHVAGSFHVENEDGKQMFHVSAGRQLVFIGDEAYDKYQDLKDDPSSNLYEHQDRFGIWSSKGMVATDLYWTDIENWADYVFEENYELSNLDEVEEYIRKNGHLPNIPSAKEVFENGYSAKDMNAKFLEKIEELTLYTIDQEKKIQSIEQAYQDKLDTLSERIAEIESLLNK